MSRSSADYPDIPPLAPGAFERILRYLPVFSDPSFTPGEWRGGVPDEDGVIQMPWVAYDDVVLAFIHDLDATRWVYPFDWPAWQDTAHALIDSPELLAAADLDTIRKLLTTHLRADRFCEGHLQSMFECGHIVAVLERIREIHDSSPSPSE